jgi:hypothetical protein
MVCYWVYPPGQQAREGVAGDTGACHGPESRGQGDATSGASQYEHVTDHFVITPN